MSAPEIQLSDFVGAHGAYQTAITLLLFVRYLFLGLMANSGPLMTPDVTFYCRLPMAEIEAIMPNLTALNQTEKELEVKEELRRICQLDLHLYQQAQQQAQPQPQSSFGRAPPEVQQQNGSSGELAPGGPKWRRSQPNGTRIRECTEFDYELAPDQGRTMTGEFDLVCDNDWMRSFFQSFISAAIVVAHVFWGTFSDKYGRFRAQKLCLAISLLAGLVSVFATNFWTFVLARAFCSFGDLGLVVSLTTTVVELVGTQYRGLSVALVNFGYALGVTLLPYIVAYLEDFRKVVALTVLCHAATIPLVLMTSESVRWLLTNRRFQLAKRELRRIMRWNKRSARLFGCSPRAQRKRAAERAQNGDDQQLKIPVGEPASLACLRLAKRAEFTRIFDAFIQQIESQNLCDPLQSSSAGHFEFSSAMVSDISVPEQEPAAKTGAADAHAHAHPQQECAPAEEESRAEQRPAALEPLNIRWPLVPRGLSSSVCRLSSLSEEPGAPTATPNKLQDSWRLAKTASCNQLEWLQRALKQQEAHRNRMDEAARARGRRRSAPGLCQAVGRQPDCINVVAHQLSFVGRVSRLFKDKKLMVAVFTIVWTMFNSELQYTSFIIINLEVGEDVYLNYILGGCMEALAAVAASLLLSYAPRRHTLIAFWLLISGSCFGLALAHIDSSWAVWLLALAKFSQSCLSSVACVAAYESFPTFLRQSGSGLVSTLGMLGSVFAPLIFAEFDDQAGMDRVLMTFSLSSLTAAILIYGYLRETKGCELQ